MFCTHCGARNLDEAKFCMKCGYAFLKKPIISAPVAPAFPIELIEESPIIPEPITEEPIAEEPIAEEPIAEEPIVEEPIVEEPIIEEPIVEEPITEEPIVEEPITEEPIVEEPIVEEPIIEEPIVEEPIIEEPIIEEPTIEEPIIEEPIEDSLFSSTRIFTPIEPSDEAQENDVKVYTPEPVVVPHVRRRVKKKKKTGKIIAIILATLVLLGGTFAALYFTGVLDDLFQAEEPRISGYYVLESATVNGEALEVLAWNDYDYFLQLNKDGTALFFNGTALIDCTYKNGELKPSEGASMAYRTEKDALTLTTAEGELLFRFSEEAPDFEALRKLLDTIGYFKLVSVIENGTEIPIDELGTVFDSFLILNEDGTGTFFMVNKIHDMLWSDGSIAPVDEPDDPASFTVENGKLTMNKGNTDYIFERSNETPPNIDALRAEFEPSLVGYFTLSQMSVGNTTINISDLEDYYDSETLPFLLINEDGTGILYSSSALVDIRWDETQFYSQDADNPLAYEFEDDMISLNVEGFGMVFARSEDTPPDIDALRKKLENTQDPSGLDLTGEYEMIAFDMGSGKTESSGAFMTLNADGTGEFSGMSVTWSETGMKVGSISYTYEIDENGILILTGSDGTFYFKNLGTPTVQNGGDFYGFWITTDCTGDMEEYNDMWWDVCARRIDNGDGTCSITFWDEDDEYNSIENPLGVVNFTICEDGSMKSSNGWFYNADVEDTLLSNSTYAITEDMIVFEGTHSDADGSYTYTICLRPWGTKWDDLEEDYWPYYYSTWYLPLIEAGESMPNTFDHP